ncbi:MAG: F0F1 ATP synthase subunit B [Clostridia bacterium]|nr:F0F1 ATP synthase subunit B [Clostridia bacterium]
MGNLEVISVNFWNIVISLCNLLLIFLIFKKFLYAPVRKMLAARKAKIDGDYAAAAKAKAEAEAEEEAYRRQMDGAKAEASALIKDAVADADRRSDEILSDAKEKADGILRRAKTEADLEMKKAEDGIKTEIIGVSAALAEKMLGREIKESDHRALIDAFLSDVGNADDQRK